MKCIQSALDYLNKFTEEDLNNFVDSVTRKVKVKKLTVEAAIAEAQKELGVKFENSLYRWKYGSEVLTGAHGLLDLAEEGKINLNDFLTKNTRVLGGKNVEAQINADMQDYFNRSFGKITPEDQEVLLKGDYDLLAADHFDGRNSTASLSPALQKSIKNISDMLRRWIEKDSRHELVKSTAMGVDDFNKYRLLKATYDPRKISKLGKDYFVKTQMARTQLDVMFPTTADVDETASKFFSRQFDNIMKGNQISLIIKDIPDLEKRSQMTVVWKDMNSYLSHEREFGNNKNLFQALLSDVKATAHATGMSKILGPDPDWAFRQIQKVAPKRRYAINPEHLFLQLRGLEGVAYDPTLAQMGANIRAWTGAVALAPIMPVITRMDWALGLQMMKGITNDSRMIVLMRRIGTSLADLGSRISGQGSIFDKDVDWKRILRSYSDGLNTHTGAYLRSFEDSAMSWASTGISHLFYKWTGMHSLDTATRASSVRQVSEFLAMQKDIPFKKLPDPLQIRLKQFNMGSPEWDALRPKFDNLATIDSVENMTTDEVNKYAVEAGVNKAMARSTLMAKLTAYLQSAADENVLHPGAAERAFFFRGTQSGSVLGEFARCIAQFKGYLASYTNRIIINGFKQDPTKFKMDFFIANLLYVSPLAALSNSMSNVLYGQPARFSPTEWTPQDYFNNMAPAYFTFSRLLDPTKAYNDQATILNTLFGTPSTKLMMDLATTGLGAAKLPLGNISDNVTQEEDRLSRTAGDIVPGYNLAKRQIERK